MKKYIIVFALFFCGFSIIATAQKLNLAKGDEYKITTLMSSTMAMKRGDKQLDFTFMSSLTNTVKVKEANANGYDLAITTTHIADTLDAFNQKLAYSSNRAANAGSAIETALSKMIGETQTVSLDQSGKITQVGNMAKAKSNAEMAAAVGLHYADLTIGNTINLGADFNLPAGATAGTTWNENKKVGDLSAKTAFKVETKDAKITKVSFKTEQSETGVNTISSGILFLDTTTGVVLQRVTAINSLSNESEDGKEYVASRKKMISEICEKVN